MKTQSYGEEKRRKTIRDYYKQKAAKYKSGPSSEDVWDVRTEPARNAFQGDFIALEKEMEAEGSAQHKAASN